MLAPCYNHIFHILSHKSMSKWLKVDKPVIGLIHGMIIHTDSAGVTLSTMNDVDMIYIAVCWCAKHVHHVKPMAFVKVMNRNFIVAQTILAIPASYQNQYSQHGQHGWQCNRHRFHLRHLEQTPHRSQFQTSNKLQLGHLEQASHRSQHWKQTSNKFQLGHLEPASHRSQHWKQTPNKLQHGHLEQASHRSQHWERTSNKFQLGHLEQVSHRSLEQTFNTRPN